MMETQVRDSSTLASFIKCGFDVPDGQFLVQKHPLRV